MIDYGIPHLGFDDEADFKNYTMWVWAGLHIPIAIPPLSLWLACTSSGLGMEYGAESLSVPESKGLNMKVRDGHAYFAVVEPTPEEVPGRRSLFPERIRPFIDDPMGEWEKDKQEAMALYKPIKEVDIEKASLLELRRLCHEYNHHVTRRAWELHHFMMYRVYMASDVFVDTCEELTGVKPDDPIHGKLVGGFDNMKFIADKEMWLLGNKATEMGLGKLFLTTEDDELLMSKLEENPAGRKWLGEYRDFLEVHGWRPQRNFHPHLPCWIDTPSLGLSHIKRAVAKGGTHGLEAVRERLSKARQQAEKELLAKVPTEQKEWFTKLMKVAQMSGFWTEDHSYYLDDYEDAIGRKVFVEVGKRFARAGVIDEPFDVFMLLPWEMEYAMIPMERASYKRLVSWRKEEWQKALKITPPLFLGQVEKAPEMARKDPIIRVLGEVPRVRPELKADLYGSASTPGVAEGIARVIMDIRQLKDLLPGEILVTMSTAPAWIPAFNIIAGAITDIGGSLAHTVIIGREYGIPVVVGTLEGTQKIKTGQRVRVDGDMNAVYILDK